MTHKCYFCDGRGSHRKLPSWLVLERLRVSTPGWGVPWNESTDVIRSNQLLLLSLWEPVTVLARVIPVHWAGHSEMGPGENKLWAMVWRKRRKETEVNSTDQKQMEVSYPPRGIVPWPFWVARFEHPEMVLLIYTYRFFPWPNVCICLFTGFPMA